MQVALETAIMLKVAVAERLKSLGKWQNNSKHKQSYLLSNRIAVDKAIVICH